MPAAWSKIPFFTIWFRVQRSFGLRSGFRLSAPARYSPSLTPPNRLKILRLTLRISPVGSRSAFAFAHAAKPAQDHAGDAHQDNTTIKLSKTHLAASFLRPSHAASM